MRGTGFIWGKMLAAPGRLSTVMMHNIDWGPTLISAAGGDGGALAANKTLMLVRKYLFRVECFAAADSASKCRTVWTTGTPSH